MDSCSPSLIQSSACVAYKWLFDSGSTRQRFTFHRRRWLMKALCYVQKNECEANATHAACAINNGWAFFCFIHVNGKQKKKWKSSVAGHWSTIITTGDDWWRLELTQCWCVVSFVPHFCGCSILPPMERGTVSDNPFCDRARKLLNLLRITAPTKNLVGKSAR